MIKMKIWLEEIVMDAVCSGALYSAELFVSFGCPGIFYQRPESEAVRKLRNF